MSDFGQNIVIFRNGVRRLNGFFKGYYFKHQKGDNTLCLIAGRSDNERFIQIITKDFSRKLPFTEGNVFSKKGIVLDIHEPGLSLTGRIRYKNLTPIHYDVMGPFCLLPMECRHRIISMNHLLEGKVLFNGEIMDFTGGRGYIEGDSGLSFPSSYTWIQANDFQEDCSIMAAVAKIPFCGLKFRGCICVIHDHGREYRLATYLGVKILVCTKKNIILKQGKYRLDIRINAGKGQRLSAPQDGEMERTILEAVACPAEFLFFEGQRLLFYRKSRYASFEYEFSGQKEV